MQKDLDVEAPLLGEEETASVASHCTSHVEPHFGSAEVLRDIVIGLSDGLTVPFALAAGLAALNSSKLVVTAGLAEIIAGSISMGLGGYLAGKSEIDHYDSERSREYKEILLVPHREEREIEEIFEPYGLSKRDIAPLMAVLKNDHDKWVDFMMKFELNLERPDPKRTWISASTIGISYLLGGFIPLLPYMFIAEAQKALYVSIGVTLLTLFIFGYFKAKWMGMKKTISSAIQMMLVGGAAAFAAFGLTKFMTHNN